MTQLIYFLRTYIPTNEYNSEREDGRKSLVRRSPKDNLADISFEDYVLGGPNRGTLSNWLEFKKYFLVLGISTKKLKSYWIKTI